MYVYMCMVLTLPVVWIAGVYSVTVYLCLAKESDKC